MVTTIQRRIDNMIYEFDVNNKFIAVFESVEVAAATLGLKEYLIKEVCNFDRKEVLGHVFRLYEDIEDVSKSDRETVDAIFNKGRTIENMKLHQYTKDGKLIKTWSSATVASRELGISLSGITRVYKGERKSCGGYVWRKIGSKLPILPKKCKPVYQYSLDGQFIRTWTSTKKIGISQVSISNACNGRSKTAGGFIWSYKLEYIEPIKNKIVQLDMNGSVIKEWRNALVASKELGLKQSNLSNAINGKSKSCGGYKWRKK